MKRLLRVGAVVLVAAIGLVGCGDDDDEAGGTTTTAAAAEPTKLTINANEPAEGQFAFGGIPTTITGGLVEITFNNTGAQDHEVQLIRMDDGHTADEVKELFANEEEGDPLPDWIHGAGGTATIKGGTSTTASVVLPDGNYAVLCFVSDENDETEASHYEKGMLTSFTVTGSKAATLPSTTATVSAQEYSLTATNLVAGKNTITFENKGLENHHAVMFPVAEGKTFDDVKASFASEEEGEGPPPFDPENIAGIAVTDGGTSFVADVDLKAGDYAFVCFITDRAGGPPHVAKGMISKVTVA